MQHLIIIDMSSCNIWLLLIWVHATFDYYWYKFMQHLIIIDISSCNIWLLLISYKIFKNIPAIHKSYFSFQKLTETHRVLAASVKCPEMERIRIDWVGREEACGPNNLLHFSIGYQKYNWEPDTWYQKFNRYPPPWPHQAPGQSSQANPGKDRQQPALGWGWRR